MGSSCEYSERVHELNVLHPSLLDEDGCSSQISQAESFRGDIIQPHEHVQTLDNEHSTRQKLRTTTELQTSSILNKSDFGSRHIGAGIHFPCCFNTSPFLRIDPIW